MSKLMSSEFTLRKVCKLLTEFKLFEAYQLNQQYKTHRNNMIAEKELEIVVLVIEMEIDMLLVIEVVIEKKAVGVFLQLKILH